MHLLLSLCIIAILRIIILEKYPYKSKSTFGSTVQYISLFERWTFVYRTDPDSASQPIAKAHVLYVYVILSVISAALPRSRAVAICPTGMKKKNIGSNVVSERAFLVYNST